MVLIKVQPGLAGTDEFVGRIVFINRNSSDS